MGRRRSLIARDAGTRIVTLCHFSAEVRVEETRRTFEGFLADVVSPDAEALARRGLTSDGVARVVGAATNGSKDHARDVDELRGLVAGLLAMVEATLGR